MKRQYVQFLKQKTLEIAEEEVDLKTLGDEEVAGHTLYTMISAGTEINSAYLDVFNWGYPRRPGYTGVFRIEKMGEKVEGLEIGDLVFCMCNHHTYTVTNYKEVVKIPEGVKPEHALFVRLAGVSMATLSRTAVTPGEKILVTGLGTVGLMAMLIYSNLGYEVIGVDPDANRREIARGLNFSEIYEKVPFETYDKQIGLALECSGHEGAVLDCAKIVRPHGEVSLVGVPWKPYTDLKSYDLLHAIFYNYVKVYSGWEMDLPHTGSNFVHESMSKNYRLAMDLLRKKKFDVEGLYTIHHYTDAQKAYDDIFEKREKKVATILSYEENNG